MDEAKRRSVFALATMASDSIRNAGMTAPYVPHLPSFLEGLLKRARADGIAVSESWTISQLREELERNAHGRGEEDPAAEG